MREILFDGKHEVSHEEVTDRMNFYIHRANEGMETEDKREGFRIAREIRDLLESEYKNNSLNRIESAYADNRLFAGYYQPAVHEAIASITGKTTLNNYFSFLYDVKGYMNYHIPKNTKN